MSLTKTQTAALCLLLAAAPAGLNWQALNGVRAETARLAGEHAAGLAALNALQKSAAERQQAILLVQNDIAAGREEIARLNAAAKPSLPPPEDLYRWQSGSEFVRLPKSILANLKLTPKREFQRPDSAEPALGRGKVVGADGTLSPVLLETLGANADEAAKVQQAFHTFAAEFEAISQTRTHLTNAMPPGVGFPVPENERIYTHHTPEFLKDGERLKEDLYREVREALGADRAEVLLEQQAKSDLDGTFREFGKYEKWLAVARQPDGLFSVARGMSREGISYSASVSTVPFEQVPEELKVYFPKPEIKEK